MAQNQYATGGSGGDVVYALGLIGAWVYFWREASGVGEHVLAVLQGIVWPAFVVYDVLQRTH